MEEKNPSNNYENNMYTEHPTLHNTTKKLMT